MWLRPLEFGRLEQTTGLKGTKSSINMLLPPAEAAVAAGNPIHVAEAIGVWYT